MTTTFDRYGNAVDQSVGYARGKILSCGGDEIARTKYARGVVRQRVSEMGADSVYDLTGLPRSYPLAQEDLPWLRSQVMYYASFAGTGEELAVRFMGGDPAIHGALFLNRVSSGLLAVALTMVERGDTVVSLVSRGRSHPPVQRSVEVAGARFVDVVGVEAFESAIDEWHPRLTVITPVTSAKHHLPVADLVRAVEIARASGAMVFLDDAHLASRTTFYGDPPPFQSAPVDLAIFSTDKHIFGPRAGVLVGRHELIERIRPVAVQFGLEAQSGHHAAMVRALEQHREEPIREAGRMARGLLERLEARYGGGRFYQAGPGVALLGEDALALTMEQSGKTRPVVVPIEAVSVVCNEMLRTHGLLAISSVSMPGSSAAIRLMMFPDGIRAGMERIETALDGALDTLGRVVDRPEEARAAILGPTAHR